MKLPPLFVSYRATVGTDNHTGWLVFNDVPPIVHGRELEEICDRIATVKKWPAGSVVLVSFQRLESA